MNISPASATSDCHFDQCKQAGGHGRTGTRALTAHMAIQAMVDALSLRQVTGMNTCFNALREVLLNSALLLAVQHAVLHTGLSHIRLAFLPYLPGFTCRATADNLHVHNRCPLVRGHASMMLACLNACNLPTITGLHADHHVLQGPQAWHSHSECSGCGG